MSADKLYELYQQELTKLRTLCNERDFSLAGEALFIQQREITKDAYLKCCASE